MAQYLRDFETGRFYLCVDDDAIPLSDDPVKRREQKARSSEVGSRPELYAMGLSGSLPLPPVRGRRNSFLCTTCGKVWRSLDVDKLGDLVRRFSERIERLPLSEWVVTEDMTFIKTPVFGNELWTPCVTIPMLLHMHRE